MLAASATRHDQRVQHRAVCKRIAVAPRNMNRLTWIPVAAQLAGTTACHVGWPDIEHLTGSLPWSVVVLGASNPFLLPVHTIHRRFSFKDSDGTASANAQSAQVAGACAWAAAHRLSVALLIACPQWMSSRLECGPPALPQRRCAKRQPVFQVLFRFERPRSRLSGTFFMHDGLRRSARARGGGILNRAAA